MSGGHGGDDPLERCYYLILSHIDLYISIYIYTLCYLYYILYLYLISYIISVYIYIYDIIGCVSCGMVQLYIFRVIGIGESPSGFHFVRLDLDVTHSSRLFRLDSPPPIVLFTTRCEAPRGVLYPVERKFHLGAVHIYIDIYLYLYLYISIYLMSHIYIYLYLYIIYPYLYMISYILYLI
jgi:hypothetical protein